MAVIKTMNRRDYLIVKFAFMLTSRIICPWGGFERIPQSVFKEAEKKVDEYLKAGW